MAIEIDELLTAFDQRDYSVRLVRTVCKVVPFAPDLPDWFSMVDGLKEIDPAAKKPVLDRAIELSRARRPSALCGWCGSLDAADSGLGVFSGVKSAIAMYQAKTGQERLDALETDTQQSIDAVLKGLAMAFVIYKLYPGSLTEKVSAFRGSSTGQAIIFYYAAVEVGLPFADNALLGGGTLVKSLFEKFGPDQQAKLAAVAGEEEALQAASMMQQLVVPVETMAGMAKEHLGGIASAAAGVAATALDVGRQGRRRGGDRARTSCRSTASWARGWWRRRACARRTPRRRRRRSEEKASAAAVPVKYTRSADDLPDSPKRGGCFGLFGGLLLGLLLLGMAGSAMAQDRPSPSTHEREVLRWAFPPRCLLTAQLDRTSPST